jgi:hypothetical protein
MSSALPTRRLGKDGPEVTGLGYGAMGLSLAQGAAMPEERRLARRKELGLWWEILSCLYRLLTHHLPSRYLRRLRGSVGQMVHKESQKAKGRLPRHKIREHTAP